ncbi:MAG: enoyl-CoA hydratase/isomerase family protein [Actinomycetota bacterium]|nr:enoyl-CoA hydratase/isomerase family protein [Actinomycetota bacterium]
MAVEGEFVTLDVRDAIGTIRLDRPPMNALSRSCAQEIQSAARQAADRTEVRAVIVYGGAKVFAAGADVKEMATMSPAEVAAQAAALSAAFRAVADIPKPTVAWRWAAQFAAGPALALAAAKAAIDDGLDVDLSKGLALEAEAFALARTEDRVAGTRSFLDHGPGKATFTGQ